MPVENRQVGDVVGRVSVDPAAVLVYEHGWQSWSPTYAHPAGELPARPVSQERRVGNYRPDRDWPATVFTGEGLLAIDPGTGEGVHVFGAPSPEGDIASVHAVRDGDRLVVSADGPIEHLLVEGGLEHALARWGDAFAGTAGVGAIRPAPTVWCSWYHYFTAVTQDDVLENLAAIGDLGLDIEVVQIDDGYQAELGDWLALSDRFDSLEDIVGRIGAAGRRAGIWVAPFFVGERSQLYREHPDWVIGGADCGTGWGGQRLLALDVTHPGAEAYLREIFTALRGTGIDYFKVDFLFAGAMEGRRAHPSSGVEAYRHGLRVIRESIGADAYLLGCGAPILPSVGLVDAMRVGPDISHTYEPEDGDLSQPSQRAAARNTRWRAWQHGRFWVNDPDCLVAAPHVDRRAEWAGVVERYGGLRASSDRLRGLDEWGLETTRRLVRRVGAEPFVP